MQRRKREKDRELNLIQNQNRTDHLPRSAEPAVLGNTITMMLCHKTSFDTALTDMEMKHKNYIDTLEKDDPLRSSLALKFPTFLCEIKMDGERMIVHVNRGVVTMHVS